MTVVPGLSPTELAKIEQQLLPHLRKLFNAADIRRTRFFEGPGSALSSPDYFEVDPDDFENDFYLGYCYKEDDEGKIIARGKSRAEIVAKLQNSLLGRDEPDSSRRSPLEQELNHILTCNSINASSDLSIDSPFDNWDDPFVDSIDEFLRPRNAYQGVPDWTPATPFASILFRTLLKFIFPLDGNWRSINPLEMASKLAVEFGKMIDDYLSNDWVVLTPIERMFENFDLICDFNIPKSESLKFFLINPQNGSNSDHTSCRERLEDALRIICLNQDRPSHKERNVPRLDEHLQHIEYETDHYIPNRPLLAVPAGKGDPDRLESDMRSLVSLYSSILRLTQLHYETCQHNPFVTADLATQYTGEFDVDMVTGKRSDVVANHGYRLPNGTQIRNRLVEMVAVAVAITPRTGGYFGPIGLVPEFTIRPSLSRLLEELGF